MKIVCTYKNDIFTNGVSATLQAVYGNDFKLWQCNQKPMFDVFDEIKPDLLIVHGDYFSGFLTEVLNEYKKTKVYMIHDEPDAQYPGCAPQEDLANIVQFNNGIEKECFKTDVLYWSRNENITDDLLTTLHSIYKQYRLKIFGPVRIDMPQYLGVLDIKDMANALASARINLDFNNNSRFDAAVNGTLSMVYDPEKTIKGFISYQNIDDITILFREECGPIYKDELKEIQELVKKDHTFHHKVAQMFSTLDLTEESDKILADLKGRLN